MVLGKDCPASSPRLPQFNSMLHPSGKIWVLQEIGMDEIAKGPELEEASKGVLFGPL